MSRRDCAAITVYPDADAKRISKEMTEHVLKDSSYYSDAAANVDSSAELYENEADSCRTTYMTSG